MEKHFKYPPVTTLFIVTAFLTLWSSLYLQTIIDVDSAWLLQCLERFIAGGTYTKDFYETNPPLSFWILFPAYPLYHLWQLTSAKTAIFITLSAYIVLADLTLYALLRTTKILKEQNIWIIIIAILMGQSWIASISFASKDALIMSFLLPLCLYQYSLTKEEKINTPIAIASTLFGGIAICLKPHYAIFPALLFAHRLYETRSIQKTIIRPDFLGMLGIGVLYLALIQIFTPEYFELLPKIMVLYSQEHPFPLYFRYYYAALAILAGLSAPLIFTKDTGLKTTLYIFAGLSLLSLIPYIAQNKGFHYQALPILFYGSIAGYMALFGAIRKTLTKHTDVALWIACAVFTATFSSYTYSRQNPKLTNDRYLSAPLIEAIDTLAWNKTYASYNNKNIFTPLPVITNLKNGSRYGEIWPFTGLLEQYKVQQPPEERTRIKQEMLALATTFAQDIERFTPSVILIPQYMDPKTKQPNKDYYNFIIQNKDFKEAMQNYTLYDTITFDTSLTTSEKNKDPEKQVPFDIFVLNREQ